MKLLRPLSSLLLSGCIAVSHLPLSPVPAAYAQAAPAAGQGSRVLLDAVREAVAQNPALADGIGDRALMTGVRDAVAQRPDLADSVRAAAKRIRPHLAGPIDQVAASALPAASPPAAAPPPAPAAAAAKPASTLAAGLGTGLGDAALLGLVGVAAASVGVAVATGGGGGGSPPAPPPPPPTTEEYRNQWGLGAINANYAYARGGTGSGVKVAVADTGLLVTHPDIDDNVTSGGYDFILNTSSITDPDGHGSHVAGIVGAEKDGNPGSLNMHGVAYDADILPLRILGPGGGTSTQIVAAVSHAVAQNAQVYNGSYGPDYSDPADTIQTISAGNAMTAAAYQNAVDNGMVMVFAAGNDFDTNPAVSVNPTGGGIYPYIRPANAGTGVYDDGGANYDFSDLEGMLIAVVATQQNGTIAGYSNRCGVAAGWCIAAPGSNILSLSNTGGYATSSGTSMAAPHVSGAVAVLIDMFPELTPEEIVERLFLSANKSGIYANSAIYGQGFLDLEKATRPIGALSVATGASVHDGSSFALAASNMNLGPAFGDGLQAALVGRKLAVFDRQNATFLVDLGDFARTADSRFNLDEALRRFRSRFGAQTITLGDGASLSYTMVDLGQHDGIRQDPSLNDRGTAMEMAYTQTLGDMQWKAQYNINPSAMFGIHQSEGMDANAILSRDAFAAPYLSFARQGYSMGTQMPLGEAFSLNVGSFMGYPLADELRQPEDRAESYGHVAELGYRTGSLKVFTQAGLLTEKQTFLGSRTEGAFDLDSGTQTSFAGVNGLYRLTPRWNLVGSYYRGISAPQVNSRSLFDDISEVQTESFSVGMLGYGVLREGDTLGLLGNQPLRVTGGEASLSLATGRSRDGWLYKQVHEVNLAPSGRELNLEAFYHVNLPGSGTQLMSSMMYRNEPGHIADAPDEGLFLLQVQQPF